MSNLKIIDCEKKGNVVRFYLGKSELQEWWGDDWDDRSFEHNCGLVYDEFVTATQEVFFRFSDAVLTPGDTWKESGLCPDDFIARKAPCLAILIHIHQDKYTSYDGYSSIADNAETVKVYFGDDIVDTVKMLKEKCGAIVMDVEFK